MSNVSEGDSNTFCCLLSRESPKYANNEGKYKAVLALMDEGRRKQQKINEKFKELVQKHG